MRNILITLLLAAFVIAPITVAYSVPRTLSETSEATKIAAANCKASGGTWHADTRSCEK